MVMNMKYMKWSYLKRFYSWIDLGYILVNVLLIAHIERKIDVDFVDEEF